MKYTKELLEPVVRISTNYSEVLRKLNKKVTGSSQQCLKKAIARHSIDISHFDYKLNSIICHQKHNSGILTNSTTIGRRTPKQLRRCLTEIGRENKCDVCSLVQWNGKDITLQIHHIDGNYLNNVESNLQLLCPNCHSQTDNFYRPKKTINKCLCGKEIRKASKSCKVCLVGQVRPLTHKVLRPSKIELEKLVWEKPTTEIGKIYGVSDKAISKWCLSYNISKPPRGYWTKGREA